MARTKSTRPCPTGAEAIEQLSRPYKVMRTELAR